MISEYASKASRVPKASIPPKPRLSTALYDFAEDDSDLDAGHDTDDDEGDSDEKEHDYNSEDDDGIFCAFIRSRALVENILAFPHDGRCSELCNLAPLHSVHA